jgi:hypothetical protein
MSEAGDRSNRRGWRSKNPPFTEGCHGADPNLQVLKRRRTLHRAGRECSGFIAAIAGFVHVLSGRPKRLRLSRGECFNVSATGFIRSSAAAVTATRFTAPATVRRKPDAAAT